MGFWSLAQRVGRYAVALGRNALAGFEQSSPETITRRLAICHACEHFDAGVCSHCGCNCNASGGLFNKLALATESCPIGKWGTAPGTPPPKITVGMAMFRDFDGVYFTVRSLALHHRDLAPHELEILVVDSHPEFPDRNADPHGARTPSERIRDLCQNTPNARYVIHDGPGGTSQPRNQVFRDARGEIVICIDSHVLLPAGALGKTVEWFARNPEFHGLVQGPMLYDSGEVVTHMRRVWDDQMLGKWEYDERYKGPDCDPFPIDMHGLGLFGCRRSDWLGFNAEFRQFGGEEGYIHDKYRLAGHEVLLLPWLEWSHRFADEHAPAQYPMAPRSRIRNYVIGRLELGQDLDDVERHFFVDGPRPGLRYHPHEWLEILEEVEALGEAEETPTTNETMPKQKFLCVCAGGNVRSVALAYLLKSMGHEAVAIGMDHFGVESTRALAAWADVVVTVADDIRAKVYERIGAVPYLQAKVRHIPLGPDVWGVSINPDLVRRCRDLVENAFWFSDTR